MAKLMDWGHMIDVGEAVVVGGNEDGLPKELECIFGGMSCIFCTYHIIF